MNATIISRRRRPLANRALTRLTWGGCEGQGPLHFADTAEHVRLLLGAGADPNARDHNGHTPLQLMHQRPSGGEVAYKMRWFIAQLFKQKTGKDIEGTYSKVPEMKPINVLTRTLDREAEIEHLIDQLGEDLPNQRKN